MDTTQQQPPAAPAAAEPFSPLQGKVTDKAYSTTPIPVSAQQISQPIPETGFVAPPPPKADDYPFAEDMKQEKKQDQPAAAKPRPPDQFSAQIADLPPKEKQDAAEKLAETVLRAYGKAHQIANNMLKISDRKIFKLQTKGEIDLKIPIPYTQGDSVPLGEFIKEYNKQVSDTLTIDPEWRAAVKPVLTRVLAKYGHGLSDEHQLLYLVAEDLITKVSIFAAMKRQTSDVLEFAKTQTAEMKKPAQAAPPPQQQQAYQQPPPQQPAQPAAQQQQQPAPVQPVAVAPLAVTAQDSARVSSPLDMQNQYTGSNHPVVDNTPAVHQPAPVPTPVQAQAAVSHQPQQEIAPAPVENVNQAHIPGNTREQFKAASNPVIEGSAATVPIPTQDEPAIPVTEKPIPETSPAELLEPFPEEILTGKRSKAKKAVKKAVAPPVKHKTNGNAPVKQKNKNKK